MVSEKMGYHCTVITFYQALYCKAQERSWIKKGELNTSMLYSFMKVIGQHLHVDASCQNDIWIECGVFGKR